jgi:hypothetical protein
MDTDQTTPASQARQAGAAEATAIAAHEAWSVAQATAAGTAAGTAGGMTLGLLIGMLSTLAFVLVGSNLRFSRGE